jgi:hypothetical protein
MISLLGIAVSDNEILTESLCRVLETLAKINRRTGISLPLSMPGKTGGPAIPPLYSYWLPASSGK